jgi:tetratricopeptide (TPR) repeat protein
VKKIIVWLCLGLIGCATLDKESKTLPRIIKKSPVVNEQEIDKIIFVFSEAIKKDPDYAGLYYNRAVAYFYKKNYEQCWLDVHKAESLGCRSSADFIKLLQKTSHRER